MLLTWEFSLSFLTVLIYYTGALSFFLGGAFAMKSSMYVLLGAMGLVILLSGCQQPYKTGNGSSASGTTSAANTESTNTASPGSPAGSLQACLDNIGDVSPGQRMLAETTCQRNAKVQEAMDSNPGDYLPPAQP